MLTSTMLKWIKYVFDFKARIKVLVSPRHFLKLQGIKIFEGFISFFIVDPF